MLRKNLFINNVLLSVTALALVALVAGCGGGGAGGNGGSGGDNSTDTTPPAITNSGAFPSTFSSFEGGPTVITVDAADSSGVKQVTAAITKPDGTITSVHLTGSGTYSASFNTPANTTDKAMTYTAVVTATDNANRTATSAPITFTVPTADAPPLPPTPKF